MVGFNTRVVQSNLHIFIVIFVLAFHEDCIVHWLMSKSFRSECPICRQLFVDLEHPIRGSQSQDTQINDQVVSDNIETNTNRNQGDDLV